MVVEVRNQWRPKTDVEADKWRIVLVLETGYRLNCYKLEAK